jgi:hypothetical protein
MVILTGMTPTGFEVLAQITGKTGNAREAILLDVLTVQKAIPPFLLNFVPIHAHGDTKAGDPVVIEYKVSPDYLCAGTDTDFLRVPLMPTTAQKVADSLNCLLPTKRMVDQIYEASTVRVSPRPYSPKNPGDFARESSLAYKLNNDKIQEQLARRPYLGLLIGGQKKDIVITNQLLKNPKKVAIYGWHEKVGKPIQPLYLGHGDFYVDYSHGIRLVSKVCKVNGVEMDLEDVLKHKDYGPILTGAEPLQITRYRLA